MDIDYLLWLQGLRNASHPILQKFFSILGSNAFLFLVLLTPCIVYWCVSKRKGLVAVFAYGMSSVTNQVIKNTICRYRPWVLDARMQPDESAIEGATGYSFPSGHSQSAASLIGALGWEWRKTKKWVLIAAVAFGLLMGFSRNFLGVHTPQDVALGLLEGALFIYPAHLLLNWVDADKGNAGGRDLRVLVIALVVIAAYLIYVSVKPYPMDYEGTRLVVDPAEMLIDCFKSGGVFVGIVTGWFVERRYVRFDCKDVRFKEGFFRVLVGLAVLGISYGLIGKLLGIVLPETIAQLVKHALVFFGAMAIAPMSFDWIHERLAK